MFKSIDNFISKKNIGPKEKIYTALNLSLPVLTGIYVFLTTMPVPAIRDLCYYLLAGILIFLLVSKKTEFTLRSPLTLPFILFSLWAVIGLFFALDLKNSIHDLRTHLLAYLVVFYLLVNYFKTPKRLQILGWIIILSATISAGAVIEYYLIEGIPFTERLGLHFKEMHTNSIAFFNIAGICLSLHYFYKNKNILLRILLVNCFVILTITILLTQSRSSLIGLMLSLAILCFHNRKNFIPIILTILIIVFLVPHSVKRSLDVTRYPTDLRVKIYHLTFEIIKEHPVMGIGFGMQTYANRNVLDLEKLNSQLPPEYQQKRRISTAPHNTILDVTLRTGAVGLLLFLSILTVALWMLYKILKISKDEYFKSWSICLLAYFASYIFISLFSDATYGPKAVILYTLLAMITILWNINIKGINIKNID